MFGSQQNEPFQRLAIGLTTPCYNKANGGLQYICEALLHAHAAREWAGADGVGIPETRRAGLPKKLAAQHGAGLRAPSWPKPVAFLQAMPWRRKYGTGLKDQYVRLRITPQAGLPGAGLLVP
jgi:hypothetical protein